MERLFEMRRSRSLSNVSTGAFKGMYLDDGNTLCQQIRRTRSLSELSTRAFKDFRHIGVADQLQKYIDGMERKADILDHLARRALFEIEQETLVTEVCDETSVAELKLKSDVDGELLKVLFNDGAILPSLPGLN